MSVRDKRKRDKRRDSVIMWSLRCHEIPLPRPSDELWMLIAQPFDYGVVRSPEFRDKALGVLVNKYLRDYVILGPKMGLFVSSRESIKSVAPYKIYKKASTAQKLLTMTNDVKSTSNSAVLNIHATHKDKNGRTRDHALTCIMTTLNTEMDTPNIQ